MGKGNKQERRNIKFVSTGKEKAEPPRRSGRLTGTRTLEDTAAEIGSPPSKRRREGSAPQPPLGSHGAPIAKSAFAAYWLPKLLALHEAAGADGRYHKAAPTLLLYPEAEEAGGDCEMDPGLQTLISTRGGTFQEAVFRCRGKALLLNFCTPSLEVYPKDETDCGHIYNLAEATLRAVPEGSDVQLEKYLAAALQQAAPLAPYQGMDVGRIRQAMAAYKEALGRAGPWRLAYNLPDSSVVGARADVPDIAQMLQAMGRVEPYVGEGLYRKESWTDHYAFAPGDWVIVDVDPKTNHWKLDKFGLPLVRTVHGASFEATYGHHGG
mmetsp:Transcript_17320/g.59225  ORF Transcript_17320/g.59225 Transcript_17320/m.59225 type:complete len:323 (+) Transcript_17320:28-996(+)